MCVCQLGTLLVNLTGSCVESEAEPAISGAPRRNASDWLKVCDVAGLGSDHRLVSFIGVHVGSYCNMSTCWFILL